MPFPCAFPSFPSLHSITGHIYGHALPRWSFCAKKNLCLFIGEHMAALCPTCAAPPCLPKVDLKLLDLSMRALCKSGDYADQWYGIYPPRAQYLPRSLRGGPAPAFRVMPQQPSLTPVWVAAWPLDLSVSSRTAQSGTMRASGIPRPPFARNSSPGFTVVVPQRLFAWRLRARPPPPFYRVGHRRALDFCVYARTAQAGTIPA